MSPLIYLFLILLLNKCSCFYVKIVNISTLHILLSDVSELNKYKTGNITSQITLETNKINIKIIICATTVMLLFLFFLVLCFICAKKHRTIEDNQSSRPSISSVDQLVRERLQDRPPSYIDSQSHVVMTMSADPPSYNDIVKNNNGCSSVYTLSKTENVNNEVLCLDNVSLNSSPPDYIISEGVINPIFENTEFAKQIQTRSDESECDPWISGIYI